MGLCRGNRSTIAPHISITSQCNSAVSCMCAHISVGSGAKNIHTVIINMRSRRLDSYFRPVYINIYDLTQIPIPAAASMTRVYLYICVCTYISKHYRMIVCITFSSVGQFCTRHKKKNTTHKEPQRNRKSTTIHMDKPASKGIHRGLGAHRHCAH